MPVGTATARMALCPHCHRESAGPEFCDHCNGEIQPASPAADSLPASVRLDDGTLLDCSAWGGAWPADGFRSLLVQSNGRRFRLRGLGPAWWPEREPAVRHRVSVPLAVLPPVHLLPLAGGAILAAECSEEKTPDLASPMATDPASDEWGILDQIVAACRALHEVMAPLHEAGFVWLNFDPAEVEAHSGRLRITNLDLGLFPVGECPDSLRLSRTWSPPEVWHFQREQIGPASDVFHLGIYAYYRLANLLPAGFPGRGLAAFDFDVPPLRTYQPALPIGIAPVIERAIARDPARRFPSTGAFVEALTEARDRTRIRATTSVRVRVDAGGTTRTGRAKAAMRQENQDALVLAPLPGGWLALAADGVTHARVGDGQMASLLACDVIPSALLARISPEATDEQIEQALIAAFHEASREIVSWSLQLLPADAAIADSDLMSSTGLVGILQGRTLHLANLGDSRACLLCEGRAEQLTVDGDIACALLADGTPPEDVGDMGPAARALRYCLGASRPDGEHRFAWDRERSTPNVTRWPLLPGDVVLLCSDGLIEEGVFLHPDEAAALVSACPDASAQELACRLADAADARQCEPSPRLPAGRGDNITCIIFKVLPADANITLVSKTATSRDREGAAQPLPHGRGS
jgi:serine/threonine protein phosphatase PrpC